MSSRGNGQMTRYETEGNSMAIGVGLRQAKTNNCHRRPVPLASGPPPEAAAVTADSPYFRWKWLLDRAFGLLLLVPGLPLIGLCVLLVRWTSRGPGLFRQVRVGKDGRDFVMYKIRTMIANAELGTGAVWAKQQDPRITPVGRVLRRLHLDELPQLFNVVRGEMSLVGPRPERPEFVEVLGEEIPGYLDRLLVAPGVTGLAQINLPPDTDFDSVRKKLVVDLDYVRSASLRVDLAIIACTAVRLFAVSPRGLRKILRVERRPRLAEPASEPPADETAAHEPTVRLPR